MDITLRIIWACLLGNILVGCSSIDHSTLRQSDSEIITHVTTMIKNVSGKGDAMLQPLLDKSEITETPSHLLYKTYFYTRRGGTQPVRDSMTEYCTSKGGVIGYQGCRINNDDNDVEFFYKLTTGRSTGVQNPTPVGLTIYLPRSGAKSAYLNAIVNNGYKTELILEKNGY